MNKEKQSIPAWPKERIVQNRPQERIVQNRPGEHIVGVRVLTIGCILLFTALFIVILIVGSRIGEDDLLVNLDNIFRMPSLQHLFGTDWVGRDMLMRTVKGLSISMQIGLISTVLSAVIALPFGILAPVFGGLADHFVSWLID